MQPDDLKRLRKDAGLTQGELAELTGFSHGFIGEMERGEKPIERRTVLAVALVCAAQFPPSDKAPAKVLNEWIDALLASAGLPRAGAEL